jgi:hypothetical protein
MYSKAVQERAEAAALAGSHGVENSLEAGTVLVEDNVGGITIHEFNEGIYRREILSKRAP